MDIVITNHFYIKINERKINYNIIFKGIAIFKKDIKSVPSELRYKVQINNVTLIMKKTEKKQIVLITCFKNNQKG